jgi:excisionase family DNA binding protein
MRPTESAIPATLAMKGKGNEQQTVLIPVQGFEPTLNSQQAAALLQIHPKTLQKMARQGRVPGRQVGDLWRFRASELDEWLRNGVSSNCHSCRN